MRTWIELEPTHGQKSFYGKAIVELTDTTRTLYSYRTKIMTIDADGNMFRHWDGWTATTGKHIAAFAGLNKKAFMAIPLIVE